MTRPRTLASHPREFFAFTEELLTHPTRTVDCGGPGPRQAFALRAGMYHFWARLRREVEETGHRPDQLDDLANQLALAGKVGSVADGTLIRALYRIAANTAISIESAAGRNVVRFQPKSATGLAMLLSENLSAPPEPLSDGGAGLLAELEHGRDGSGNLD